MHWALPGATAGLGLKHGQVSEVLATRPDLGFFEVHAENYLVDGGPLHQALTRIREHFPLSVHGVGLSIGGPGPLDATHLNRLAALIDRYQPAQFSEHLAWSSHGEVFFNDLLPLPYTAATLERVCAHIDQVQSRLGRTMLLENPATYVEFHSSTMSEGQFLTEVVRRTGCGLLLDLNNVFVSCSNHGRDPQRELAALPLHAVGEIHLASFATDQDGAGAPLLIDHHGAPVDEAVWALYGQVIAQLGAVPTLLERDNELPALGVLVAEAQRAQALLRHSAQAEAA
jgi:hypothetical protein